MSDISREKWVVLLSKCGYVEQYHINEGGEFSAYTCHIISLQLSHLIRPRIPFSSLLKTSLSISIATSQARRHHGQVLRPPS